MNKQDTAIHLAEDTAGNRFLIYSGKEGLRLDIRRQGEVLWLSQAQMAELFGVDRTVITKHIANILAEGESTAEATCAKFAQVRRESNRRVERQVEHYNLDMVISVGYRVSSKQATLFRRWATGILVQYAKNGFVVDSPRLKQAENFDRIKEFFGGWAFIKISFGKQI